MQLLGLIDNLLFENRYKYVPLDFWLTNAFLCASTINLLSKPETFMHFQQSTELFLWHNPTMTTDWRLKDLYKLTISHKTTLLFLITINITCPLQVILYTSYYYYINYSTVLSHRYIFSVCYCRITYIFSVCYCSTTLFSSFWFAINFATYSYIITDHMQLPISKIIVILSHTKIYNHNLHENFFTSFYTYKVTLG